jgi:hypothetical protein
VAVRSGRFQSSGSRFSPYHGCRAPPVSIAERPAAPLATHHDPRMRYRARARVLERIQSGQRLGRGDELEPRAHAAEGVAERELAFGAVAHERALVHARFGRGREERREERGVRRRRRQGGPAPQTTSADSASTHASGAELLYTVVSACTSCVKVRPRPSRGLRAVRLGPAGGAGHSQYALVAERVERGARRARVALTRRDESGRRHRWYSGCVSRECSLKDSYG